MFVIMKGLSKPFQYSVVLSKSCKPLLRKESFFDALKMAAYCFYLALPGENRVENKIKFMVEGNIFPHFQ